MAERCYDADVCDDAAVVLCANSKLYVFSLQSSGIQPVREVTTTLKRQLRCVTMFRPQQGFGPSAKQSNYGFAVGSIEGRVAVQYIDPAADKSHSFAFKCHRESGTNKVYAVNSIHFHPVHHTFATAGSDGKFVFWDKDERNRLKMFDKIPAPEAITCGRFSGDGKMYAYAQSYDWHKGVNGYNKGNVALRVHWTFCGEGGKDECIKKPKAGKR